MFGYCDLSVLIVLVLYVLLFFGLVGLGLFGCLIVLVYVLFVLVFAIVGLVFGLDCCVVVLCNCVVSGISFSFVVFVSCWYVVWFDLLCFAWWFR